MSQKDDLDVITQAYVSIPKGAIMSDGIVWGNKYISCFNSKRCDYEFGKVGWKSYYKHVSIPKGAIMRGFVFVFSSLRSRVSIPKGAIMSVN